MPLTDFQTSLATRLAANRTFDSYLAGGAAILIEPTTTRYSNDLDYFHDSEQRVAEAYDSDRRLLEEHDYTLRMDLNQPGYIRAIVQLGEHSTDLLRRRGRVRQEDLARLKLAMPVNLQDLKKEWLEALDSVEPFATARPPEEIGCLYYSPSRQAFVDPRDEEDAVLHFGRPGGVVPRLDVSG